MRNRILRYSKKLQLEPWCSYELVPLREVKETAMLDTSMFEQVLKAVKEAGFAYTLVEQPNEILIEQSDGELVINTIKVPKGCNYPNCDGGPPAGYCHVDCRPVEKQ